MREIRRIEGKTSIEVHFAQKGIPSTTRTMMGGKCKANHDEGIQTRTQMLSKTPLVGLGFSQPRDMMLTALATRSFPLGAK